MYAPYSVGGKDSICVAFDPQGFFSCSVSADLGSDQDRDLSLTMASAAATPEYDLNGDPYNGDAGDDENPGLDSADTEGYMPTYTEAFPPLPSSNAGEGQKLSQSTWAAQTQAIRSSTITQVTDWYERYCTYLCWGVIVVGMGGVSAATWCLMCLVTMSGVQVAGYPVLFSI
jgi:hypothetical protein